MARTAWFDDADNPLIDDYAQELSHFLDSMADGKVDNKELSAAEGVWWCS